VFPPSNLILMWQKGGPWFVTTNLTISVNEREEAWALLFDSRTGRRAICLTSNERTAEYLIIDVFMKKSALPLLGT
jgi:hypothetical protein